MKRIGFHALAGIAIVVAALLHPLGLIRAVRNACAATRRDLDAQRGK